MREQDGGKLELEESPCVENEKAFPYGWNAFLKRLFFG